MSEPGGGAIGLYYYFSIYEYIQRGVWVSPCIYQVRLRHESLRLSLSWFCRGMSPGSQVRFATHLQVGGSLKSGHLAVSHSPTLHPRMTEVVTRSEEGGMLGPKWSGPSPPSSSLLCSSQATKSQDLPLNATSHTWHFGLPAGLHFSVISYERLISYKLLCLSDTKTRLPQYVCSIDKTNFFLQLGTLLAFRSRRRCWCW